MCFSSIAPNPASWSFTKHELNESRLALNLKPFVDPGDRGSEANADVAGTADSAESADSSPLKFLSTVPRGSVCHATVQHLHLAVTLP